MPLYNVDTEILPFASPEDLSKCKAFAEGASQESKDAIQAIIQEGIEKGTIASANVYLCIAVALSEATDEVRSGIPSSDGRVKGQRPGFEQDATFEDLKNQNLVQTVRNPEDPSFEIEVEGKDLNFFESSLASLTIARPVVRDRELDVRLGEDDFTKRITRNLKINRTVGPNEFLAFERLFTTNKFLLQGVTSPRSEKFQVIETFDSPVGYLFGQRHEIYTFSGVLIDTKDFKWKKEFLDIYNDALRATRCAELGAAAYITYLDDTVEGFVINAAIQESVNMYGALTFTFSVLVKKRKKFSSLRIIEERQVSVDEIVNALVNVRGVQAAIDFLSDFDTVEPVDEIITAGK